MKKYKLTIYLCSVGIILVSLLMIVSTYAYFSVKVNGEGQDITINTFDDNTTIIYNDTSNVSMFNAYTGDEIVKTFSIENTSNYNIYYDIILANVVNNFIDKKDLVYTLESSNNGAKRSISVMPSNEESIAKNVLITPKTKHEYTMTITFLKKDKDQSKNMNKTFSSNVSIVASKLNINESIYKENSLLKEIITNAKYEDATDNGIYITNNSNNGNIVYYYKGDINLNNNLILNNMCFKIIRTDENYGIRIIYNGEYIDNKCTNNIIDTKSFNTKSDYNAYVGYMYGDASSNNYINEHNNINESNIKTILDNWYKEKFVSDDNISKESIYCNYRTTNDFTLNKVMYSKNGYGKNNTGYYNINEEYLGYECSIEDSFSVNNSLSNKKLTYPVGIISANEVLYSGDNSYLLNIGNYWTMTPAYFNGSDAYNYTVTGKKLIPSKVTNNVGIKPVLSLSKDTILLSGDGSNDNPYIVK